MNIQKLIDLQTKAKLLHDEVNRFARKEGLIRKLNAFLVQLRLFIDKTEELIQKANLESFQ